MQQAQSWFGVRGPDGEPTAEVTIDVANRRIDVKLTDDEIAARLAAYSPPQKPHPGAALSKYAKLVQSASQGAVTI